MVVGSSVLCVTQSLKYAWQGASLVILENEAQGLLCTQHVLCYLSHIPWLWNISCFKHMFWQQWILFRLLLKLHSIGLCLKPLHFSSSLKNFLIFLFDIFFDLLVTKFLFFMCIVLHEATPDCAQGLLPV